MNKNPIDLLFANMEKLGPGSDAATLHVLGLLPNKKFEVIGDAGCGTGRQTLKLAEKLQTKIHAVDSYEPFLNDLARHARKRGIENLVELHCIDMKDIAEKFRKIDLLWSEGSAYNIGFFNALKTWAPVINADGFVVVSELSWLREQVPAVVTEFFESGYPDMHSIAENIAGLGAEGYKVLQTYTLPPETWVDGYYDVLEPRAKSLINHPDLSVRNFASETLREIEIFPLSEESYGYVFYILQRS